MHCETSLSKWVYIGHMLRHQADTQTKKTENDTAADLAAQGILTGHKVHSRAKSARAVVIHACRKEAATQLLGQTLIISCESEYALQHQCQRFSSLATPAQGRPYTTRHSSHVQTGAF